MNFLKNNREMVALVLIIGCVFVGVAGVAVSVRGGQPWAYNGVALSRSVDIFVASVLK